MKKLSNLMPKRVFEIFEELASIPHGSGNTKKLAEFCVTFAKNLGLSCVMDTVGNVVIYKAGSCGREQEEPVVLQAHLDMVCAKEAEFSFDFEKDGILVETDGETVWANGTTLGADNGIGVAMILAILEDNALSHPPIEGVLTMDEETGLIGASHLDGSLLKGKRMLNLDSEDEGVFTAGCAGGSRVQIDFPLTFTSNEKQGFCVSLQGLLGGHSGIEIHKNRLNANVVLSNILYGLLNSGDLQVASLKGGSLDNAIAKEASCVIVTSFEKEQLETLLSSQKDKLKTTEDYDFTFTVEEVEAPKQVWSDDTTKGILSFFSVAPYGVQAMCEDLPDVVETSLNLGITATNETNFTAVYSLRSSVEANLTALGLKMATLAKEYGGLAREGSRYPAWEFRSHSPLRNKMEQVFEACYCKKPVTEVIHAGLECGVFGQKIKDLDAVSLGPNMVDVHTPKERVWVDSVERVFHYLCELLKAL